jgi:hypothetical protein
MAALVFTLGPVSLCAQEPSQQVPKTQDTKEKAKSKKAKEYGAELPVCDVQTYSTCHRTDGVIPPKLIHSGKGLGPAEAGLTGSAELAVVVDESGMPRKVILVRPFFFPGRKVELATEMNEGALKTVRSYRFKPATLNGKPVPVLITVTQSIEQTGLQ